MIDYLCCQELFLVFMANVHFPFDRKIFFFGKLAEYWNSSKDNFLFLTILYTYFYIIYAVLWFFLITDHSTS